jgi:Tol biopolymer transport system component
VTLAPGARLGPYEILAPVGAGGMGEVFRARDTKLNRDVAIKVLPAAFADDPDRLARFTREAQVLASLNHPNIAAIYGIEESSVPGPSSSVTRALVMELVEGEDLSAVMSRGALPLVEALPIARQIADALEAAHERGIIHRDLKPANVKVRADGTVKVLDFGLAKAADPAGASNVDAMRSPTMTARATQMGMIVGTAAYMAPEQARGRAVDRRADIWAFGVVLYEMLSGRRAFEGEDVSITLANVMKDDVVWDALPRTLPPSLRILLGRCLEKDPKKRLGWIGEARLALEPSSVTLSGSRPAVATPSRRTSPVWLAASLVLAGITGAAVVWQVRAPAPAPEERLEMASPTVTPPQSVKISPDATAVAILADDKVWVRKLSEFAATAVTGSEGARAVFWSPDGSNLGFEARGKLWRISTQGGTPIAIGAVPSEFTPAGGAAWGADGRIVFSTGISTVMQIRADGSAPASDLFPLIPQKDEDVHDVSLLPDGTSVLFALHPAQGSGVPYEIQIFADGKRRTIFAATSTRVGHPVYSPTGHVIFEMDTNLWAMPFSLKTKSATGDPVKLAGSARAASVARDGTMVMLSGTASTSVRLTEVDVNGKAGAVIGTQRAVSPRLSPDGRLVAASVGFGTDTDIWIFDLERHTERRLTFDPGADRLPSWSPDGKTIVYSCGSSVCARPADGGGARVELVPLADYGVVSPDGRRLVFIRGESREAGVYAADLGPAGLAGPAATPKLIVSSSSLRAFSITPDGRFIAYHSTGETGVDAVFVTKFPVAEGKWEVPVRGATQPLWSPDGRHLFVQDELSRIVDVPVTLQTTFVAGTPEVMRVRGVQANVGYDRTSDGKFFIVPLSPSVIDAETRILVIRHWAPK